MLGWLRRKFRGDEALVLERALADPVRMPADHTDIRDLVSEANRGVGGGSMRLPGGQHGMAAPARPGDVMQEATGDLATSEVLATVSVATAEHQKNEDWLATAERKARREREKHVAFEAEQRAHREAFIWKAREHFQLHLAPVSDPIIKGAIERSLMSLARLLLDPAHDEVPR